MWQNAEKERGKDMIGIIGAMNEEVEQLIKVMQAEDVKEKAGMTFHSGKLEGKDVVLVVSGIGKVNAAACTQILCDDYNVDAVVNTGIAGSLDARIDIGDIVLSSDILHHDVDATGFGYPLGQIPRMDTLSFEADKDMLEKAKTCCSEVLSDVNIHVGRIVSGDQFVSDKAVKEKIASEFAGLCTEMEGAAIAQTAYINKVPFLIIRAISDKADDSATVDYPVFEAQAIRHSVALIKDFVSSFN